MIGSYYNSSKNFTKHTNSFFQFLKIVSTLLVMLMLIIVAGLYLSGTISILEYITAFLIGDLSALLVITAIPSTLLLLPLKNKNGYQFHLLVRYMYLASAFVMFVLAILSTVYNHSPKVLVSFSNIASSFVKAFNSDFNPLNLCISLLILYVIINIFNSVIDKVFTKTLNVDMFRDKIISNTLQCMLLVGYLLVLFLSVEYLCA